MEEMIEITNGRGVLSVKGGHNPVLLLNGEPVAMHWPDYLGSVGRYLVRSGQFDYDFDLKDYRYIVEGGFDPSGSLAEQFSLILDLFDNGRYYLTLDTEDKPLDWEIYEFDGDINYDTFLENFYPEYLPLIATRPRESLNEERGAEFVEHLGYGIRPIVVTASTLESKVEFVIDGHHKLYAYARANLNPRILNICRLGTRTDTDEAVQYIRDKRTAKLFLSRFDRFNK